MSETRPRQTLSHEEWTAMANDGASPLVALWGDTREIYALLRHDDAPLLVSTEVVDGGYPALSRARPDAAWFERMVRDLWGHIVIGAFGAYFGFRTAALPEARAERRHNFPSDRRHGARPVSLDRRRGVADRRFGSAFGQPA